MTASSDACARAYVWFGAARIPRKSHGDTDARYTWLNAGARLDVARLAQHRDSMRKPWTIYTFKCITGGHDLLLCLPGARYVLG